MKERAILQGRRAVELYPVSEDAAYGLPYAVDLAHIYAILAEHDAAIEELDNLLSIPGWISAAWLEIDPRWNTLREHPGFQRLLSEHSIRQS